MSTERRPRWGVLGVGGISNDFCIGLIASGSAISAVGARDAARAELFAAKVKAQRSHASYDALVRDPEVDVVYVGTIHTMHLPHARLALEAGKHVVCEKPLGISAAQVQELVGLAQKNGVFLMEAMWTRFFPAIRKVREVLSSGLVGTPLCLQAEFGFVAPEDETHRLWDPNQAGGAMLDIGCYLVQLATMVFGSTFPQQIACTGQKSKTGVDSEGALALTWEGKGTASLLCSLTANTPENSIIICTNGHILIHGPSHCPSQITVVKTESRGKFLEEVFKFELPKCPKGLTPNYPRSEAMVYQVQAVEECLNAGRLECPEYPLSESLIVAKIMDTYRKQLDVTYPCEKKKSKSPLTDCLSMLLPCGR